MASHYTSQILILNTEMCSLASTKDQGKMTLTLLNDRKSTPLIDMSCISLFGFFLFTLFLGGFSSKAILEDVVYFRVQCVSFACVRSWIQSPSPSERKVSVGISSCSLAAVKKRNPELH